MELTASDTDWEGRLCWSAQPGDDAAFVSVLETTLGGLADRVECGHLGTDSFCAVACARG